MGFNLDLICGLFHSPWPMIFDFRNSCLILTILKNHSIQSKSSKVFLGHRLSWCMHRELVTSHLFLLSKSSNFMV
jgi:hypothetical protein